MKMIYLIFRCFQAQTKQNKDYFENISNCIQVIYFQEILFFPMYEEPIEDEQQFVVPPHPLMQFTASPSIEQSLEFDTLIVALYGPSSIFVRSLLQQSKPHYRINFQKAKQKSLADIFVDKQKRTGSIVFNSEPEKMKEVHFVSDFLRKSKISYSKLVVVACEYRNNLEEDEKRPEHPRPQEIPNSLEYIKNSFWKQTPSSCSPHKHGVQGIGADLLTYGEIHKKASILFVGLFKDYQMTEDIVLGVYEEGLVKVLNLQQKAVSGDTLSTEVKRFNMNKYKNNIYL